EAPTPSEYRRRFGVEGRDLPPTPLAAIALDEPGTSAGAAGGPSAALREAAAVYRSRRDLTDRDLAETLAGSGVPGPYADLFRDLHRADPRAADRLALGVSALPE